MAQSRRCFIVFCLFCGLTIWAGWFTPFAASQDEIPAHIAADIENLKYLLTRNPEYAETWTKLGQTYFELKQYEEAIEAFREATRLQPEDARLHRLLGIALRFSGDIDGAILQYLAAIRLKPNEPAGHFLIGIAYLQKGDFKTAEAAMREALRLRPDDWNVRKTLTQVLLEGNKRDQALPLLRDGLRLDRSAFLAGFAPDMPPEVRSELERANEEVAAHMLLGVWFAQREDHDRALEEFQQAARLDPNFPEAYTSLGALYHTKERYEEAVKWYRKAAEQGYARGQTLLGLKYDLGEGVREDDAEAVKWYRKAAEQGYARGQALLGLMYAGGEGVPEDDAEAMRWYQKAAEQGNAMAHQQMGKLHTKHGVYDEAIASHRKALEVEPDSADNHESLALALMFNGEYDQAKEQLRQALRLEPEQRILHAYMGFIYFLESRFDEATKEFEKYSETMDLTYPTIHYHLALKHVGRHGEAEKLLQDYVEGFKGKDWELSLLHYHQGKLTESDLLSRASDKEEECEAYFYIGYQYLLNGDKQKAREYFQKSMDTKAFNYFEYVGARARLEQLGAK